MSQESAITRRKFLTTTATITAGSLAARSAYGLSTLGLESSQAAQTQTGTAAAGEDSHLSSDWKEQGVLNLSKSPHAKLKNIPVRAVVIQQGFWSKRRTTNVQSSIPSMHDELVAHGRMDNFRRLEGKSSEPQKGPVYSDSDIYKWTEAVGFVLQSGDQPALRQTTEAMIRDVVAVQEPSGYLNTYFVGDRASERMQPKIQTTGHELYNIGHLLQGAIAYYRATGDPTLLEAGMRFVDNFLLPNYGPAPNQKPIVAGHPEIEMSLIELYRTTGNRKYLDLAGYILHGDDRIPLKEQQIVYMFCGIPFTSRTKLEGHAVRAMYACCGATDYYLETGDPAYLNTLQKLWHDLYEHQMYITGGVGARSQGEAFGDAYELPNERAYGESCAAIGNMMWNWRMLAATGDARHADVIERALYNGINSGMSLDGRMYCYRNPLAFDPTTGDTIRNPWYDTTCCPPNLERTLASLPGYFYSTAKDGVYVHLYDNSEMKWPLESGNELHIKQQTNYPWDGAVALTVAPVKPEFFTVYVRIPGWSRRSAVKVNGVPVSGVVPGRYLAIARKWSGPTVVEVSFDMEPQIIRANPAVAEDTGRIAIQRGPVVYCMEGLDQEKGTDPKTFSLYTARLTNDTKAQPRPEMLDGIVLLEHPGSVPESVDQADLYQSALPVETKQTPTSLRLIPYYAWSNREKSSMQVWVPYVQV